MPQFGLLHHQALDMGVKIMKKFLLNLGLRALRAIALLLLLRITRRWQTPGMWQRVGKGFDKRLKHLMNALGLATARVDNKWAFMRNGRNS